MYNDESLKDILNTNTDHIVFNNPSCQRGEKGRPSKGSAWIVKRGFKDIKCLTYGDRISKLEYENQAIIGVYMPYNDHTQKGYLDYEQELLAALHLAKTSQKEAIIMGDFNIDPTRDRQLDKKMFKIIEDNGLRVLEPASFNDERYTFESAMGKSWIDHVMIKQSTTSETRIEILYDDDNDSDHRAIFIERKCDNQNTTSGDISIINSKSAKKNSI